MVSRVFSAGLSGIDGYIVTVECFLSGGLPRLDVALMLTLCSCAGAFLR